jgi:hypothetical protein
MAVNINLAAFPFDHASLFTSPSGVPSLLIHNQGGGRQVFNQVQTQPLILAILRQLIRVPVYKISHRFSCLFPWSCTLPLREELGSSSHETVRQDALHVPVPWGGFFFFDVPWGGSKLEQLDTLARYARF